MKCFGFHNEKEVTCTSMCTMSRRCRAVTQTHGDMLVGKYLQELLFRLDEQPDDTEYLATDQVPLMVEQLIKGPVEEHPQRTALRDKGQLNVLAEEVDLGDID